MRIAVFVLAVLLSVPAIAEVPLVTVEKVAIDGIVWDIRITSRSGEQTIRRVELNFGTCEAESSSGDGAATVTLREGDSLIVHTSLCDPTRVRVETDHGSVDVNLPD